MKKRYLRPSMREIILDGDRLLEETLYTVSPWKDGGTTDVGDPNSINNPNHAPSHSSSRPVRIFGE